MQFQNTSEPQFEPFTCETCGQNYMRLDHLTRHIRSHTQERPFECQDCEKTFARADLLKRHSLLHDPEGAANKRQKTEHTTRAKTAQACIACAKSKLRCDGAVVCLRCSKKNIPCVYKTSTVRAGTVAMGQSEEHQFLQELHTTRDTVHPPHPRINGNFQTGSRWSNVPEISQRAASDNVLMHSESSVEATTSSVDIDDSYLGDFLRDILHPAGPSADQQDFVFTPKDFLDFTIPTSFENLDGYDLPQLSTNDDTSLQINFGDHNARLEQTGAKFARSGNATPTGRNGLSLIAQAFKESQWLWTPQQGDNCKAERANLSLPVEELISKEKAGLGTPPFPPLGQTARDKILAMVLDTCDSAMTSVVVSSFPSAELLTILIHKWSVYHTAQVNSWFHFPRFDPNTESPDLLISIAAAGAALSKNAKIRRLGYAFQEAARAVNNQTLEGDNRNIRRLKPYQMLVLILDVGLWSGDRRKVEIAESIAQPLVTMVRRGGYFGKLEDNDNNFPSHSDDLASLERKWAEWIELESMRRMVAHVLIRDCQTSASLLVPPLISFAEMKCVLPAPRSLWMAKTAQEWAERMWLCGYHASKELPSVRSCLHDINSAARFLQQIDTELAILTVSNAFWVFCWQHLQVEAVLRQTWEDIQKSSSVLSSPIKHIAVQRLQQFRLTASEWQDFRPEAILTCERLLMNLHVSLEDVQLLAGKAGEKEARRTFSTLKHWTRSSDSRQAVWHAGQVIRAAKDYPAHTLRDASAVAVYHSGLVFWAYALLTNADKYAKGSQPAAQEIVLNDQVSPHLERFVMLGRGVPTMRSYVSSSRRTQSIPLSDARRIMNIIIELLQTNNEAKGDECPPLVENLNKLMRSLGNAARSVRDV